MKMAPVKLTVVTRSGRAVARGGFVFLPHEENVVVVCTRPSYLEIRACVDLRILSQGEEIDVVAADADAGDEPTDEGNLSALTVPQLLERAEAAGLDIPKKAKKADIIDALESASFLAANADASDAPTDDGDPDDLQDEDDLDEGGIDEGGIDEDPSND